MLKDLQDKIIYEKIMEKIQPLAEKIYIAELTQHKDVDFSTLPYDSWLSAYRFFEGQVEFEEIFGDHLSELFELLKMNEIKEKTDATIKGKIEEDSI
jgi:hypothetical protein